MSIVKDLVRIIGGEILVLSTESIGSVFAVKLPVIKDETITEIQEKSLSIVVKEPDIPIKYQKAEGVSELIGEITSTLNKKSKFYVVIIEDEKDV